MACQLGCDNCSLCDLRLTRRTAIIEMERETEGVGEVKVGLGEGGDSKVQSLVFSAKHTAGCQNCPPARSRLLMVV